MLTFLVAGMVTACAPKDPIDRLIVRLEAETKIISLTTYPFQPIDLPATASPTQLVAALSNRGDFRKQYAATTVKIVKIREVQTPADARFGKSSTAVLLDSDAGQKIVLFQPMNSGCYFRIYDSE